MFRVLKAVEINTVPQVNRLFCERESSLVAMHDKYPHHAVAGRGYRARSRQVLSIAIRFHNLGHTTLVAKKSIILVHIHSVRMYILLVQLRRPRLQLLPALSSASTSISTSSVYMKKMAANLGLGEVGELRRRRLEGPPGLVRLPLRVAVQPAAGLRRLEIRRVVRPLIVAAHQLLSQGARRGGREGRTHGGVRLDGERLLVVRALVARVVAGAGAGELGLDFVDEAGHDGVRVGGGGYGA